MLSARSRALFRTIVVAVALYTALLSWWCPLTSDAYHHALTGMEHSFNAAQVWDRCVSSYLTWNPRLGEFMAFALATAGKGLFALINPFMVLGLVFLMFYMITGRRVCPDFWPDVRSFGFTALLLLTCTARPGVTLFWISGAANYCWASLIWLGFLCLYRPLLKDDAHLCGGPLKWLAVLSLGFLAGMTNEANIPGTWLLLGCLFAYVRLLHKRKLPAWFYGGLAAHLGGALCMLLSPGIAARLNSAVPACDQTLSGFWDRIEALTVLIPRMHEYHMILPLCLTVFLAWTLYRIYRRDRVAYQKIEGRVNRGVVFIVTAYVMTGAYCVAVVPSAHALFTSTLMFGMGLLSFYHARRGVHGATRRLRTGTYLFLTVTALYAASTLHDHYSLYVQYKERERLILAEKAAGVQDITVPALKKPSPWCTFIFWVDYEPDPNGYVSRGAARYYGVKSIKVEPEK